MTGAYPPTGDGYAPEEVSRFEIVAGIGCLPANCAIELEDRFNPAFEDAMIDAVLFVLAAAKFPLDLNVGAFPETRGEFAELPESETAVPFGP